MELLKDAESVMPVTTFPYPVLRSLAVDENGHIGYKWPTVRDCAQPGSRNALPRLRTVLCLPDGSFFPGRNNRYSRYGPLLLPELEVQDIDTEEDWAIAEVKYQKMMEKE